MVEGENIFKVYLAFSTGIFLQKKEKSGGRRTIAILLRAKDKKISFLLRAGGVL